MAKKRRKKHPGRQFAEGQSGNPAGREKGCIKAPTLLVDMRWAKDHPDDPTDNPMRKRLQTLFKDDFEKFLNMLRKDEAEYAAKKAEKKDAPEAKDEGTDRIEELIEEILKEAERAAALP